jgi:hypothetical protein
MPYNITKSDYSKILKFYGLNVPKSENSLKKSAEDVLAKKLCSCIKKVGGINNQPIAIGICTKAVLNNKGLSRGKFNCKGKKEISLIKTKRKVSIGKKTRRR